MQYVGVKRTCLFLAVVLSVACGPKAGRSGGGGGGPMPAAVSTYAGLRWVPADATYALAARRTDQALVLLKNAIDGFGIAGEVDAAELSRESTRELGFDVLSPDAYAEFGVDLDRGLAIWSRGLGPSVAVPLADPQRLAAEIERRRGPGTVVQVSRAHDVEVFTIRPDRDASFHWVIAGDWFLAHLEVTEEHEAEGAWFEEAWAARGGFAGTPEFTAAIDEGTRRVGAEPPVVGVARVPAILAHPLVEEPSACGPTLGALGRVFLAAGVEGGDSRGAVVFEVPAGVDAVRALISQVPAGWAAARAGAPVVAEVGLDMRAAAAAFSPCVGEDLGRDLEQARSGRLFVHAIDLDGMKGKGAASVELANPRMLADMLSEIPGIGFLSKQRALGPIDVTDVNAPGVPRFSYAQAGASTVIAVSSSIDALLTGGMVAGGDELARFEVLPRAWPAETWDELLASAIGREEARADTVRRLRAWTKGEITLALEGRSIVLTAHGTR